MSRGLDTVDLTFDLLPRTQVRCEKATDLGGSDLERRKSLELVRKRIESAWEIGRQL